MASLIYTSFFEDLARGAIDLDTDTFWVMLTTSSYTENKDTHTKRSDVTNEVAAGGGYSAGGQVVTFTVTKDTTNDRLDAMRAELSQRIVESEIRTAPALTALSGDVRELTLVLRQTQDLRPRVTQCEEDIAAIKRRLG
jgi:hypothetical protein